MVSSLPTQSEQPKRRSNDPISWYLQNIGSNASAIGEELAKLMRNTKTRQIS